jgi:hypothetical protein
MEEQKVNDELETMYMGAIRLTFLILSLLLLEEVRIGANP